MNGGRQNRRLRVSDQVIVITGKDKGKTGSIERILGDSRAIVSGLNMVKKHRRPNPQINEQGGIVEQEAPIHLSNLALPNPDTGRAARIGVSRDEAGKPVRVFKSAGKAVAAADGGGKQ